MSVSCIIGLCLLSLRESHEPCDNSNHPLNSCNPVWAESLEGESNSQCGLGVACCGWNIWSVPSPHVEPDGSVCWRWSEVLRREQTHVVTRRILKTVDTVSSLFARESCRNLFETRKDQVLLCYNWQFSQY